MLCVSDMSELTCASRMLTSSAYAGTVRLYDQLDGVVRRLVYNSGDQGCDMNREPWNATAW